MTELSKHAKDILRAVADGKRIGLARDGVTTVEIDDVFYTIYQGGVDDLIILPDTRTINGVEFEAPVGIEKGGYSFTNVQYHQLKEVAVWESSHQAEIAFDAIINALTGVNQ